MLKKIGIGFVILVAVFVVVGLFMPSKWSVERFVVTTASPETVSTFIVQPRKWTDWAAWNNEMDPEAKWTYFGAPRGVGAKMAWSGPKMGKGILTITAVEPGKSVSYEMEMEGTISGEGEQTKMEGGSPAKGGFTFTPEGTTATRITWRDEGDMGMNLLGRFFIPVLEDMLTTHFDIGLANLKKISEEAEAKKAAQPAIAAPTEPAAADEAAAPALVPAAAPTAPAVPADAVAAPAVP